MFKHLEVKGLKTLNVGVMQVKHTIIAVYLSLSYVISINQIKSVAAIYASFR